MAVASYVIRITDNTQLHCVFCCFERLLLRVACTHGMHRRKSWSKNVQSLRASRRAGQPIMRSLWQTLTARRNWRPSWSVSSRVRWRRRWRLSFEPRWPWGSLQRRKPIRKRLRRWLPLCGIRWTVLSAPRRKPRPIDAICRRNRLVLRSNLPRLRQSTRRLRRSSPPCARRHYLRGTCQFGRYTGSEGCVSASMNARIAGARTHTYRALADLMSLAMAAGVSFHTLRRMVLEEGTQDSRLMKRQGTRAASPRRNLLLLIAAICRKLKRG